MHLPHMQQARNAPVAKTGPGISTSDQMPILWAKDRCSLLIPANNDSYASTHELWFAFIFGTYESSSSSDIVAFDVRNQFYHHRRTLGYMGSPHSQGLNYAP